MYRNIFCKFNHLPLLFRTHNFAQKQVDQGTVLGIVASSGSSSSGLQIWVIAVIAIVAAVCICIALVGYEMTTQITQSIMVLFSCHMYRRKRAEVQNVNKFKLLEDDAPMGQIAAVQEGTV